VNTRTLQTKEKLFKLEQEPYSEEYQNLLKEHWYAVVHEFNFPLGGELYKITYPSNIVVNAGATRVNLINMLFSKIKESKSKESALYFKYLESIKEVSLKPKKEDLELIAKLCGYSKGWVHYKELELKLK
jgi:hypothetical protein